MRSYGRVAPQFWTGRTGKMLREAGRDAQVIALYLLTCPGSNMIGLYYLPIPTLAHETGISLQGASKALRRGLEAPCKGLGRGFQGGFARYHEPTETVWVPEMARFQIGPCLQPRDHRIDGVVNLLLEVRNSPFIKDFVEKYSGVYHLETARAWKPLARALEAPWKPLPSQEQEQDQEQEQKDSFLPSVESSSEPPPDGISEPPLVIVARIPRLGGGEHEVTQRDVDQLARAYPAVDVPLEIERAKLWLETNPNRKKRKVGSFLARWMSRVQERGGSKQLQGASAEAIAKWFGEGS